jgi:hypothetical protein
MAQQVNCERVPSNSGQQYKAYECNPRIHVTYENTSIKDESGNGLHCGSGCIDRQAEKQCMLIDPVFSCQHEITRTQEGRQQCHN